MSKKFKPVQITDPPDEPWMDFPQIDNRKPAEPKKRRPGEPIVKWR